MTITERHQQLVAALNAVRFDVPALTAKLASGAAVQRLIDAAGADLIEFEEKSGIAEGRRILLHEQTFQDGPTFEALVRDYSPAPDDAQKLASGELTDELLAQRAEILRGAKEALRHIARGLADVAARRKKLSREALTIANSPDPLTWREREIFSVALLVDRPNRMAKSVFAEILKPLEPVAA